MGFGFEIAWQKGSHLHLRRMIQGHEQNLTVPLHKEIDVGTTKAIFNQASRYIPLLELRAYFYTK